jgi:uncharacterized protein YbjT (DUF2867 family)
MKVAVAGGTGLVGSQAVTALREQGDDVVVLSRGTGVDLISGDGLAEALAGVEAIVDCTSTPAQDAEGAREFFGTVARNLQAAAAEAGVRRVVTLSIIGLEAMAGRGHYAGKLAQEKATREGSVPATILRATQFHDFGGQLIEWLRKGPIVPVPMMPVQTVDTATVGCHLARLAHGDDEGRTVQLAGPQRSTIAIVARRTARARRVRVLVVPLWLPGETERHARRGAALPPADAIVDGPSFDDWVSRQG